MSLQTRQVGISEVLCTSVCCNELTRPWYDTECANGDTGYPGDTEAFLDNSSL